MVAENFKIAQLQILYEAGYQMGSDLTWHHYSEIEVYESTPKPQYNRFQLLHHQNMCKKGMIACEVGGIYYMTAKSFLAAMRRKPRKKL